MNDDSAVTILGIDTGGTFTDYVGIANDGTVLRGKVNSTPDDPSRALEQVLERLKLAEGCRFVHGTTVATNAMLEHDLADTVLVTNEGLDGLLDVGRGTRPELYNLNPDPDTVRPFDLPVVTVSLRDHPMDSGRDSLRPEEAESLRKRIQTLDPSAVAICLVHSYRDESMERMVEEALRELDIPIVPSVDVLPRFREYERAGTTTVNAGLIPVVAQYLSRLNSLDSLPSDRYLMGSDRGALTFNEAADHPVRTVLSGPTGGVIGSRDVLEDVEVTRFITMDMGGTSTDVTVVEESIPLTDEHEIGRYPVSLPMVDVHTVGSGGGSIVRIDEAGSLRVGPSSAGADPGPACYGRGGPPTRTDAQLLLGRIPVDRPLSEELTLDVQAARSAYEELADSSDQSVEDMALGVIQIARTKLVEAVRSLTVQEGKNPSKFRLIVHGGAGGLFGAGIAEELGIGTVYVPRRAGVASAAGLLAAPQFAQRTASPLEELDDHSKVPGLSELQVRAPDWKDSSTELEFEAECRYRGQTHAVTIPFHNTEMKSPKLRERFVDRYRENFGYTPDQETVEVVHLNAYWTRSFNYRPSIQSDPDEVYDRTTQEILTQEGSDSVGVRELETYQETLTGPSLLSGSTTTVYVPPGWTVESASDRLVRLDH